MVAMVRCCGVHLGVDGAPWWMVHPGGVWCAVVCGGGGAAAVY